MENTFLKPHHSVSFFLDLRWQELYCPCRKAVGLCGWFCTDLSVRSVTKKAAWSALWSHSIILSELPKYLSTEPKWCFKPCYLVNNIKVMSRLTCFVFFGLPSVWGNGISTVCRNLVAFQCSEWVFLKKKLKCDLPVLPTVCKKAEFINSCLC